MSRKTWDNASAMKRVGMRELNHHLARYVAEARGGESVEITDRGRPVARIVPLSSGDAWLDHLVAIGRVRPAKDPHGPLPEPYKGDPSVSVADELIRMRDDERY